MTGWSQPRLQQDLPDPICFASLMRLSTKKRGGRNRLLFSNPDSLTRADGRDILSKDRKNLTVYLSYDEGDSRKLLLARFNLEWLTSGKDSLPKQGHR